MQLHTPEFIFTREQTSQAEAWRPVLHPEQKWGLLRSKPQQKGSGVGTLTEPEVLCSPKQGSHA